MADLTITGVKARQIYDSRGRPTLECDILTQQGQFRAAVPSGASTGIYEALELRDGKENEWLGKGVKKAVANINTIIAPAIMGKSPLQQKEIDDLMIKELDGTTNEYGFPKAKLGANAILAVSLAVSRAGAAAKGLPLYKYIAELAGNNDLVLPVPAFNVINGGSHAGNQLAYQEFMILPTGAKTFAEAMQMGAETYQHLKKICKKEFGQGAVNVGDEGGFAPDAITDPKKCVDIIAQAIEAAGYTGKIVLGMDVAASEFHEVKDEKHMYNDKKWVPEDDGAAAIDSEAMVKQYQELAVYCKEKNLPLQSVEDGFDQDDWEAWSAYTAAEGEGVQVVGDDLLVTNPKRIEMAIEKKACNSLLLKVNQIGSLSESIEAVKMAKKNGWGVMTSHRSGETSDPYIADLAVGLSTGQIKTGAPCRSERLAKYNQLLRIEEDLIAEGKSKFAGLNFRKPCEAY
jgi:enolase